jgi:hypothetical protein
MSIENIYKPFNYSEYGVYVIKVTIPKKGVFKIEDTLPLHIKLLKGIYFTCNVQSAEKVVGHIRLNLNEGILKNVQLPIMNTSVIRHTAYPIPLNETLKSNSLLQGYFINHISTKQIFTLKIYLHYEK